jgi:hypothetical protein
MSVQTSSTRLLFCSFDTITIFVVYNMQKRCGSARGAMQRGSEDLRRTSGGGLAWMARVRRRQSGKAGAPCHGSWALVEPRDHAVYIDGGSGRDVLQVGLRHAPIPGPAQPKGAPPLGERPFNTRPAGLQALPRLTRIPRPRGLYGLGLLPWRELQTPGLVLRTGTGRSRRTGAAVLAAKLHDDRGLPRAIHLLRPTDGLLPLGTVRLLPVPGDGKLVNRVGPVHLALPALAWARGASQHNAVGLTAFDEQLGADRGRIDKMLMRGQVFLDARLLDSVRTHGFMDGRAGRMHMGEQVWRRRLARFVDVAKLAKTSFTPVRK